MAGESRAATTTTSVGCRPLAIPLSGPKWRAFALPSYHDGRVRLNIAGREKRGIVPAAEYVNVCRQISDLVGECRNLLMGNASHRRSTAPSRTPTKSALAKPMCTSSGKEPLSDCLIRDSAESARFLFPNRGPHRQGWLSQCGG